MGGEEVDFGDKFLDLAERAAANGLVGNEGEEAPDLIEPGTVSRDEVPDIDKTPEPPAHRRCQLAHHTHQYNPRPVYQRRRDRDRTLGCHRKRLLAWVHGVLLNR